MKGTIYRCAWCGAEKKVPYGGDKTGWTNITDYGMADDHGLYPVQQWLCPACSEKRRPSGILRAEDV